VYARPRSTALPRLASLLLAAALALPALGRAQAPAEAQSFLEAQHAEVERLMRQPEGETRDQRLSAVIGQLLDYDELARRSLSRHWAEHSAAEQREFSSLLRQLVERSYRSNLESTLGYDVRYLGAEAQGTDVLVRTTARSRTNRRQPAIAIDYALHRKDGRWQVFDVWTDGVSLVENYRSQFNRIIRREGWDALLQKMRDRITSGSEGDL